MFEQIIPVELQQLILDMFRDSFPELNDFEALKPALQDIKEAMVQGDFDRAFGTPESLERYTIRWSPSRALVFSNVLAWICNQWPEQECVERCVSGDAQIPARVLSFGRGAAEHIALAAVLKHLHPGAAGRQSRSVSEDADEISQDLDALSISRPQAAHQSLLLSMHQVDTTNWSDVLSKLHHTYTTPPTLSKYASTKARASNNSFLSDQALSWKFIQLDVLECGVEQLRSIIGLEPTLLTLFFTLGELYSTSISKTSAFLLKLTLAAPHGSLLLVVDSPGAHAETTSQSDEQAQERIYPVQWLMYQALYPGGLQKMKDEKEAAPAWKKLAQEDNYLFQLAKGLQYSASLENMKFQLHLLERL